MAARQRVMTRGHDATGGCRGWARRALALSAAMLALLLALPVSAFAHPMGNFSISHYSALRLEPEGIVVRYFIDMAEIPTFQEVQDGALVAEPGHPTLAPYLARQAERLRAGLRLEVDGRPVELTTRAREIAVNPGVGGLPTLRLGMVYRAAWLAMAGSAQLAYRDDNFPERVGWKEIVATAGPGIVLASSSVPGVDRSTELSDYPSDLLQAPPQALEARLVLAVPALAGGGQSATSHAEPARQPVTAAEPPVTLRPAVTLVAQPASPAALQQAATASSAPDGHREGRRERVDLRGPIEPAGPIAQADAAAPPSARPPAVAVPGSVAPPPAAEASAGERSGESSARIDDIALRPNRQRGRGDRLADLILAPGGGLGVILLAALAAIVLGGLHALEPGHGKTVVAAYLVGARGTARHALLLGLTVTASHTAGVYLLGAVTLYASRYVVPERLYPWLGALSGLTIAALGFVLFLRRYAGANDDHGHAHSHGHEHGDGHEHDHAHEHELADGHAHDHANDRAGDHLHHGGGGHEHDGRNNHGRDPRVTSSGPPHVHGRVLAPVSHHHGLGGHHHRHLPPGGRVSLRELLALGVSGGIVPCPGALVVLLSAIALGRIGFGLFLIAAFSVGLAAVLVSIGLLMVYARRLMASVKGDGPIVTRWLPLASSAVMTLLGLGIAVQALVAAGIVEIRLG